MSSTQGETYEPIIRPVMPELDVIRGLAILMVIFYHGFYWLTDLSKYPRWERLLITAAWPGRLGVNLFFILSGFLITGILLDARSRPNYYARFYKRRALRILPAYLLILLALVAARKIPTAFAWLSLSYLSNLTPLFGVAIAYPVLWSLAVEEHFYFFWPAVVKRLTVRGLLATCAAIVALSPLLRFFSFPFAKGFEFNDYTWNSLDGLALGAILGIVVRIADDTRQRLRIVALGSAAIAAVFLPFAVTSRNTRIGSALQVVPFHFVFAALLAVFLLIGTSKHKRLVHSRVIGYFGYISYGLYLVHVAVFQFVDQHLGAIGLWKRFLLASGAAVLLASLSRTHFENRFLALNEKPHSERTD